MDSSRILVLILLAGGIILLAHADRSAALPDGPASISVSAGNVTQLYVNTTSVTRRWAGFFGNLSGEIRLDDASNFTLYLWAGDLDPRGEVYAGDAVIGNWLSVRCVNLSAKYPGVNCSEAIGGNCLNITEIQNKSGGAVDAADSINTTFNYTSTITVDINTINQCPATRLFGQDSQPNANWTEVLLTENNTNTLIYAAIINQSIIGFNNQSWDFNLLLGENGDDVLATTYYFYTELD